jgi:hypothetical protein
MNGIVVVLILVLASVLPVLGFLEAEMVTSSVMDPRSEKNANWCLRAGFLTSSTWLTESQLKSLAYFEFDHC